jgi:UDP-N-acetylglucosamine 1-carboxyvinyltransferase
VFENRFKHGSELQRMGAKIRVEDRTAYFEGNTVFSPSIVKAVDLRAGAAVILAALATEGRTMIEDIALIERGYDNIVSKLRSVGANIRKIEVPENSSQAFFSEIKI